MTSIYLAEIQDYADIIKACCKEIDNASSIDFQLDCINGLYNYTETLKSDIDCLQTRLEKIKADEDKALAQALAMSQPDANKYYPNHAEIDLS